jgi:hypothetical protein
MKSILEVIVGFQPPNVGSECQTNLDWASTMSGSGLGDGTTSRSYILGLIHVAARLTMAEEA